MLKFCISKQTIATLVWRCLLGLALTHLRDLSCPTLGTRDRSPLCSMERGSSLSLLLVLPQGRPMHSRWFSLLHGMGFLWHRDCSPFYSSLKLFILAMQGSEALLSSNPEEALYKSP